MSDVRQNSLFYQHPNSPEEINRHTPMTATVALFKDHLIREGKTENTVTSFVSDLQLVMDYLDGATPVGQFTTTMLSDFMYWLDNDRGVPCSRKSYARRVTTIKVYFKWLFTLGAVAHDPAKALLQRSGPAPLSHVLSQDDIDGCIDFSRRMKRGDEQDYRPEMLLRLLLDTGIKKSEIERLTPSDIDQSNPHRPILLIRHKTKNQYKERRLELDSDWIKVYELYRGQYPSKPGSDKIITCTTRNLEYILTDIGEGADVPFKLSFEVLRWTSAVHDYRNGVNEDAIREKLGLSKVSWYETGQKIKTLSEQLDNESAS